MAGEKDMWNSMLLIIGLKLMSLNVKLCRRCFPVFVQYVIVKGEKSMVNDGWSIKVLLLDLLITKGQKYYPNKNDSYPPFSNTPVNIIENNKKAYNSCKIKEIQKRIIK